MSSSSESRRGAPQYRILLSQEALELFKEEAVEVVRDSIHHLEKPASKKDVADAMVKVARRHRHEVIQQLLDDKLND